MLKITSEEPEVHWPFLNAKDMVVLDLGCGKFYSSISTAEWFLNQEAKQVIGVDLGKEEITDPRFVNYVKAIKSSEDLNYFLSYNPDVIKCDIEGAEKYFGEIPELPDSVKQFAVEYHDESLKNLCFEMLVKWGFKNIELYQLFNENINRVGVYHAWK